MPLIVKLLTSAHSPIVAVVVTSPSSKSSQMTSLIVSSVLNEDPAIVIVPPCEKSPLKLDIAGDVQNDLCLKLS